jgi:hypothetical protein
MLNYWLRLGNLRVSQPMYHFGYMCDSWGSNSLPPWLQDRHLSDWSISRFLVGYRLWLYGTLSHLRNACHYMTKYVMDLNNVHSLFPPCIFLIFFSLYIDTPIFVPLFVAILPRCAPSAIIDLTFLTCARRVWPQCSLTTRYFQDPFSRINIPNFAQYSCPIERSAEVFDMCHCTPFAQSLALKS